ncbi:Zn-dependent hydrolase [Lacicoccus alkaliphilus]|uniref:N-carbamoyl-L-amino-acid hydrolase n=1 Tax=Lacicoccus alkaliphilus DSM 16010 TaxID=1123231 RepID=A0A1M7JIW2_9BACL|nr:Zn-dependent hydrolase [Salinicoccus alkaliphilus]SHM52831.1 N-carbamoyl-L-amino-acid hydrolase [Salinicoccus alkaliphilus DSM 16010]
MNTQTLLINGQRLQETIEDFAGFGGTINGGVTRLALSEADINARAHFKSLCEETGMTVKCDDMGNMYARLDGLENNRPPLVIGSHLDSVEKGGKFDGALGVIAGLEIVRTLRENDIKPRMPIVVMNITNEEGARFEPSMMSSGVLSGWFDKHRMMQAKDAQGTLFKDALLDSGYEGSEGNRLKEAQCFLELHIEQGPILESEQLSIGVVEAVMGMVCYQLEVTGASNHAGTTPMKYRKDALFAANDLITEIRQEMDKLDDNLVYTMGRMNLTPNIHTVIPNKVVFTLEARHQDMETIRQVEKIIQNLKHTQEKNGCHVKADKLWGRKTVQFDEDCINLFEEAAEKMGYPYKRMVSGAGHDAQFMAANIPTAMIFVPSKNGISHSEEEFTRPEDLVKGVNVLLQAIISLVK